MSNEIHQPSHQDILTAMKKKGFKVFSSKEGYDLNIIGLRTNRNNEDEFNDWITVSYLLGKVWNYFAFPATTDPGVFYRKEPLSVRGTAILKPGQYPGSHMLGKHRGYKALQQKGKMTVYRDKDKDEELTVTGMDEDEGVFGINIHRANAFRPSLVVGKWSAGCQVLQDSAHFGFLMVLSQMAILRFGNSLSYTLLTDDDLE